MLPLCFLPLCGVFGQGDIEERREGVWWKLWDSDFPMVGAGAGLFTSPLRSGPPRPAPPIHSQMENGIQIG